MNCFVSSVQPLSFHFQLLYQLIKRCLDMAVTDGMTTIAFPTLGCGKLNYNSKDVCSCFREAEQDTKAQLQVELN